MKTTANFIEELLQRPIIESDITDLTFSMVGQLMKEYAEHVRNEDRKLITKHVKMTGIAYGNDTSITDYEVDIDSILNTPKLELK